MFCSWYELWEQKIELDVAVIGIGIRNRYRVHCCSEMVDCLSHSFDISNEIFELDDRDGKLNKYSGGIPLFGQPSFAVITDFSLENY